MKSVSRYFAEDFAMLQPMINRSSLIYTSRYPELENYGSLGQMLRKRVGSVGHSIIRCLPLSHIHQRLSFESWKLSTEP